MLENPGKKLRELMAGPNILVAPGVFNGFSAHLVNQSGFPMAYGTGGGCAATILGAPDIGLATMNDLVTNASHMASILDIPLLYDADNGFGNALNVIRTVHEYEKAGVAGIHIEDQVMPKRCGHLGGKVLVSAEEHAMKIKAAANERYNKDFVICARTDARAVEGFDAAIDRSKRYIDAGADVIFFEAIQSIDEMERVGKELGCQIPLLINMFCGGKTPPVKNNELEQMGYKIAIYGGVTLFPHMIAMKQGLDYLKEHDTDEGLLPDDINGFDLYWQVTEHKKWQDLEKKYS